MSDVEAATNIVRYMLRPIQPMLDDPGLTDLHIIGPGQGRAFVDVGRGMQQITLPYALRDLKDLALYSAAITRQDISEATPLVSTNFPDGERVHIHISPAVEDGIVAFSIRKPKAVTDTPDDLERSGTFERAKHGGRYVSQAETDMKRLYLAGRTKDLLTLAVETGANIIFAGAVGTGKTHQLRSFANCISPDQRIITVQDTHELTGMVQPNVLHTFYSKGGQSAATITAEDLVEGAMRLGMDWLINQELRDGGGAMAYVGLLDSGHKVLSTVHSETAASTRSRICGLVKKHPAGQHMDKNEIMASLYRGIDLIVHCKKEKDPKTGTTRRFISEVLYDPEMKERYADTPSPLKTKEHAA